MADIDGSRLVDHADLSAITATLGQANANGDGVVDATDKRLAINAQDHKLANGLRLGLVP